MAGHEEKKSRRAGVKMSLSKKIRFEIFKRDGFKCQYCGQCPPETVLEVDHIFPVSKGGGSQKINLITSCFNCNRGKGAIPLSVMPKSLNDSMEELKEKEDQIKEYRKLNRKIERRIKKDIKDVSDIYSGQYTNFRLSEYFCNHSLKKFLNLLPKNQVMEFMEIATDKFSMDDEADSFDCVKYFCGMCWKTIKGTCRY